MKGIHTMSNTENIISKYTAGKAGLEETNSALKKAGCGFHLNPERNVLTEEEIRKTTIGAYPDMASGWGLLDTGTGSLDKVEVRGGKLMGGGIGRMYGVVYIAGRSYEVDDDTLTSGKAD